MNTTLQNIQIPQILTDKNGDSIAIISADEYKYLLDAAEMYEDMIDIQEFEAAKGQELRKREEKMEYHKKYTVLIGKKPEKFLETLSEPHYSNIVQALELLSENPRPFGRKKLTNDEKYRVRVGNYRILYEIHEDIITVEVVKIGHRKDVYKKK